jgi:hypothetical protein
MVITYHGDNFFRVQSGSLTLVSDATNDRMKPDISLKTLSSSASPEILPPGNLIDSAGEFDVSGVSVKGIQIKKESAEKFVKTVFSVSGIEDLRLCFLGHLTEIIDSEVIEKIGAVDILFLPVGNPPFLSVEDSVKIIKQISPKIIIPSFHGKNVSAEFLKNLGQESSVEEKLVLKSKDLPERGMKVVALKNE